MSGGLSLEQRYRRVLRVLPGYYRDAWGEDMVAAFLDSWLTGDPKTDAAVLKFCRPGWREDASVIGLAARLYLGGPAAPRRYFAWGQAVRGAVLAVTLLLAVRGLDALVLAAWSHIGWLPAPPASLVPPAPVAHVSSAPVGVPVPVHGTPAPVTPSPDPVTVTRGGLWFTLGCLVDFGWIVTFAGLVLGRYRAARVVAALATVATLILFLRAELTGASPVLAGPWAYLVLLNLIPVLAMAAFHPDAPPAARWPWLLALPVGYFVVAVPLLVLQASSDHAWVPDLPGRCCLLVALACLVHVPRARFRRNTGSGVWSLTLALLAAVAGVYRLVSLTDFVHNPHLLRAGLAELLIMVVAAALVAPDAAHAQAATQTGGLGSY